MKMKVDTTVVKSGVYRDYIPKACQLSQEKVITQSGHVVMVSGLVPRRISAHLVQLRTLKPQAF